MQVADNHAIPETGQAFWSSEWEVYTTHTKDYLNYYRLPYDVNANEFIWGPGEYPANGDETYNYWDES